MGPGPPPGAAIRSSTPKVRSSCQPVESSGAKIGMAEFRTASAAKAAPVVDKKAIKHVKLNLDMFPLRTELRFLTRINLLRRRFNHCQSQWRSHGGRGRPEGAGTARRPRAGDFSA